ncbi:hypothetical protein FGO68_gene1732 [Halteria grandinella]|uniref:Uncharacterized protein n=1 Tax=Halteria grandinella TaxID=5974 RepID=A0A8J8NIX1_HALGN|nr:hypothetical protein FGO68_gene1732 [Halteria grandinella]
MKRERLGTQRCRLGSERMRNQAGSLKRRPCSLKRRSPCSLLIKGSREQWQLQILCRLQEVLKGIIFLFCDLINIRLNFFLNTLRRWVITLPHYQFYSLLKCILGFIIPPRLAIMKKHIPPIAPTAPIQSCLDDEHYTVANYGIWRQIRQWAGLIIPTVFDQLNNCSALPITIILQILNSSAVLLRMRLFIFQLQRNQ